MPKKKPQPADQLTPKMRLFVAAYAGSFSIKDASEAAGCHRRQHHAWMKASKKYADAFALAVEAAIQNAEAEVYLRAIKGRPRYKFTSQGVAIMDPDNPEKPYVEFERSDRLLEMFLKAYCPEKYRENVRQEIVGANGGPVQLHMVEEIVDVDPDEDNPPASNSASVPKK